MIMFGLKYESLIVRLKKPETTIGRHTSNHIVIPKSLKVSRFHAVISFHGGAPLIKDISEWGVYLNNTPVCKHRWAELKLGDVIALGGLTADDGGRMLEVVAWEPEDTKPYITVTNGNSAVPKENSSVTVENPASANEHRIEVIDITEGADDVYVIDICSDDETTQEEGYPPSQTDNVPKEVIKAPLEIALLSDDEDDVFELPAVSPRKSEELIEPLPLKTDELIQPSPPKTEELIQPPKTEEPIQPILEPPTKTKMLVPSSSKMDICSEENQITAPVEPPPVVEVASPSTRKMEISPIENQVEVSDEIPSVIPTEPKLVDVTPSMNGLLKKTEPLDYPKAFRSIMDYSSDEDNSSFDDRNSFVDEDVKCGRKDVKLNLSAKSSERCDVKPKLTSRITKSKPKQTPRIAKSKLKPMSRINKIVKHEPEPIVEKYFEEIVPSKWTASSPVRAESENENEEKEWHEPKRDSDSTDTGYRSPLDLFSSVYEGNDDNEGYSSDDSTTAASDNKAITPIIHRTLLTNKIAKIAVIAPLPNKTMVKRGKRKRWDSPESRADVERDLRLSESPPSSRSKPSPEKKSKSSPPPAPREKKLSLRAVRESTKQAREKIKAMFPLPPTRVQRTAETRPKPKVKVTNKNRGDFLTKMEVPCHRSPAKPVEPKNVVSPKKSLPKTKPVEPEKRVESPPEPTKPVTPPPPEPEKNRTEHRRSIDEILDEIDINAVGGVENKTKDTAPSVPTERTIDSNVVKGDENYTKETVPFVSTERTIEVSVSFAKAAPLKPYPNWGLKVVGESILKKSNHEKPYATEKKRVSFQQSFPKKKIAGVSEDDDLSRFSFSTMMSKMWPDAECNNCGSSDHSTKRCTAEPVCYKCLRTGHIAVNCTRPMMCFNCKRDGHKGSECPLPDIRLNPDYKPSNRSFSPQKREDEGENRRRIRDPRLKAVHQKSDESA